MEIVPVTKDESQEGAIPSLWRNGLKCLADTFVDVEAVFEDSSVTISSIDGETKRANLANIADYPDILGKLAPNSWNSSVCMWMEGHWDVLVDLSDENGETTDLVLHAKVQEDGERFMIKPGLIYVP